ncbi:MAG TPA: alpha/beta hydrolase [Chloroflexota bacterium]|nr:alpha/beta hydrolase [Chloroflexota bacterium]
MKRLLLMQALGEEGVDGCGRDGSAPGSRAGWLTSQTPGCRAATHNAYPMAHFSYDGHRLAYTVYGEGERVTVLIPGLLLSQKMQAPLARSLAGAGHRVVTFDPLGHGDSDRPRQMWRYSMPEFARQTVALLDHLGLEQAVVGGTSLGANVTLEVAAAAPDRLRGMVIEMPVLDNAIPACGAAFTPLLFALTFGEPGMRALARVARAVPRRVPFLLELFLDWISQDPGPSGAVLQGILFGRTAPEHRVRESIRTPALVIGHPRDPVHPFSDAGMLAAELPNGRLVNASSIIELRANPRRLTREIAAFLDEVWAARAAGRGRAARAAGG